MSTPAPAGKGIFLGGGAVPRQEAPLLHLVGGTKHIMMHLSGRGNISVACLTALSKGIKPPSAVKAKIQTRETGDTNLAMFSAGEFSLTYNLVFLSHPLHSSRNEIPDIVEIGTKLDQSRLLASVNMWYLIVPAL